jgi:hypothetical protein
MPPCATTSQSIQCPADYKDMTFTIFELWNSNDIYLFRCIASKYVLPMSIVQMLGRFGSERKSTSLRPNKLSTPEYTAASAHLVFTFLNQDKELSHTSFVLGNFKTMLVMCCSIVLPELGLIHHASKFLSSLGYMLEVIPARLV